METLPPSRGGIKCFRTFAARSYSGSKKVPTRHALRLDFDPSSVLTCRMINRRILLTGAGALVAQVILSSA
jgi:hypothetical protein